MDITYEDVKRCFRELERCRVRKPYRIDFMAHGRRRTVIAYTAGGCWRKVRRLQKDL